MPHEPAADRYDTMQYRACGRSGLRLPAISLGAWETFGGYRGEDIARACLLRAFDLGITHFDFANNYGTPPGNAEVVCGRILRELPRDELILSSKAGFRMWPGPYGEGGSRKYLISSCDQSLRRMGIEYFDIFYSHCPDPGTPVEETLGALEQLVRQGKALYAGLSNYGGEALDAALAAQAARGGAALVALQPSYSLLNRGFETELLPRTQRAGLGVVAYCPLASGLLTDKYLGGEVPAGSRASEKWGEAWVRQSLTPERRLVLHELSDLARARGQSLAQMALAWVLRLPAVTTALIGASSVPQLEENVASLRHASFSVEELRRIQELTA